MRKALILILLIPYFMNAQTATLSPAGEYYLRGVMETASGFKLDKNGTFQFFYSYGALDRFGSGKWTSKGDHVILNSEQIHPRDFALVRSEKQTGDNITIKITDANAQLLHYVYGVLEAGETRQQSAADREGMMVFAPQKMDTIYLLFEFCPEKQSAFAIPANGHNYFEFRVEPWIMEVYFENFDLQVTEDGLKGDHPILAENRKYTYEKAGH